MGRLKGLASRKSQVSNFLRSNSCKFLDACTCMFLNLAAVGTV
ncbi:hypothetical protein [Rubritalea tangerina]